ncbi:MAG: hypothetical protein NVS4B10_13290 [Myxococcales bacterium]
MPRRHGNHLRYIGEALAPIESQLCAERMQRLVLALSLVVFALSFCPTPVAMLLR